MIKSLVILSLAIIGVGAYAEEANPKILTQEKINIIKQDQIDSTDVLAIPLDDSEVEDMEELDAIKEKEKELKLQRKNENTKN